MIRGLWFPYGSIQERKKNFSLASRSGDSKLNEELLAHKSVIDTINKRDDRYVILAQHLCKTYPNGKEALRDFSIRIRRDKIFALLGPNGAGKTTFLSILTGALQKTSGHVYFEGEEVVFGERTDAKIGFCPQFDVLWPSLTVDEHFIFFTKFKDFHPSSMPQYIDGLVNSLHLGRDRQKKAIELSGGMRRRVSLGNAVSGEPRVIFLDEPSSGLDPVRRREFWELIRKVGVGRAVVLTTHLMEEADVLSDEIGIMLSGELKTIGTANYLKDKYGGGMKMQIVLTSLDAKEKVLNILSSVFSSVEVTWEFDKTLTLTVSDKEQRMRKTFAIARDLQNEGLIQDWSLSNGSLEEVFLTVTNSSQASSTANKDFDLLKSA
jgi:ABC-type multidrug transport system ATPase subunit